ncbi:MAG: N-6 DNA methylase, partial [Holosporaceae bacterium]|nr:N-6 DNA methylase [Holosporaceae bacterium]
MQLPEAEYISNISKEYRLRNATEHSYRPYLKKMIEMMQIPKKIVAVNEPKHLRCGSPDFVVLKDDDTSAIGYIETKDLGRNLDDKKYQEQFDRYRTSLNNLIITNYLDFFLYEDGELVDFVKIGEKRSNDVVILKTSIDKFKNILGKFIGYRGHVIDKSSKLAQIMASKTKMLAKAIYSTFFIENSSGNGELQMQFDVFRKVLMHDITISDFSDIYAQTITYGMFVGRMYDRTPEKFSRQEACELIPKSHPFLRRLFDYIAGNNVDERIRWMVDDIADMFAHVNSESVLANSTINNPHNDPIFDFYQPFLANYDNKLRYTRGVWYTPQPAVDFIVRTVDHILCSDFGLKNGLADTSKIKIKTNEGSARAYEKEMHRVQILDPAVGTGTFLASVINLIYDKYQSDNSGAWSSYVDNHLLPRLNGFEVLMAPYTVAHLKLDMVLKRTGYSSKSGDRLRIYLTNSLEEPPDDAGTLFAAWLSNEAREASFIKKDTPVMVILGNPPYSVNSSNRGKQIIDLLDDYKKDLNEKNIQPLSDDYIKFIRFGQYQIEKSSEGILAYICNNGFLDGVIHRQMRKTLLEVFDKIYILNLHGNSRKKETCADGSKDENVFDIMQGVSINIFVKTGKKTGKNKKHADVFHHDLYGTREKKYNFLSDAAVCIDDFSKLAPVAPYYF